MSTLRLHPIKTVIAACLLMLSQFALAYAPQEEPEPSWLEAYNRFMFSVNQQLDRYLLKPVALFYKKVTPTFVDRGITNFFENLDDVETLVNSIFQLKPHNTVVTFNRLVFNTTFGLGGFIDVATGFGLHNDEEDFGQTLGYWGWQESEYLVLPFYGPSTFRDALGRVADAYSEPLQYIDEIHSDAILLSQGVKVVDVRADALAAENLVIGADLYGFVRNAYLQNRDFLIKDGNVEDPFANEDFDDFEGL